MKRSVVQIALLAVVALVFSSSAPGDRPVKQLNMVFIGNSITQGAGLQHPTHDAPPARAALYLGKRPEVGAVKYANRGVSGCTTVDYLPQTNTLFPKACEAADTFRGETWATLLFSIMLGTNDSATTGTNGCPVSAECYKANIRTIVDQLLALYPECRVVLHRPVWYSPNTYNGAMYLKAGLDRLQSYYPQLTTLVDEYATRFPGRVFMGDTAAFDFFKSHYLSDCQAEEGNAGTFYLHPNVQGAARLGEFWGKAICHLLPSL